MTDDDNGSGRRPFNRSGDGRRPDRATGASARGDRVVRGLARAGDGEGLAPVTPLFGARGRPVAAHPSWGAGRATAAADDAVDAADALGARRPRLRPLLSLGATSGEDGQTAGADDAVRDPAVGADETPAAEIRERAEAVLVRKLRSRSLSLSEARGVLRSIEEVDDVLVDDIIDHFVDLGYLDDATFAEQLAMSAVEKKGEGRRAVAETLRKRGIPREIAEAALAALPDDDAERALEFARTKVRGVEGAEFDTALRRLAGQLARRGYPSSVALTAARTALSEAGIGRSRSFTRPASGVRFTPDD